MIRWQLQDARNCLSELVRKAREEGPRVITARGRDAVVVSAKEFGELSRPHDSLVDFFRKSPLAGEPEARGEPLPVIDGLIAATGLAHDLIIATRNTVDFKRCGAHCLSPWMPG